MGEQKTILFVSICTVALGGCFLVASVDRDLIKGEGGGDPTTSSSTTSAGGSSSSTGGGGATSTATTGGGGATSTTSTGGGGGMDCLPDQKLCGGNCVDMDDPAYGCTDDMCDPCNLANATATCSGGACAIAGCTGSYDNCDDNPGNGCEVDLTSDINNCNGCGNVCAHGCEASKCNPVCGPGNLLMSTQGLSLCYVNEDTPPNSYIALAGKVEGQDTYQPLVQSDNTLCIATSISDTSLVCNLGLVTLPQTIEIRPYSFGNPDGTGAKYPLCDPPGFPSSDCEGSLEPWLEAVSVMIFVDDNNAGTPPPPPSYYTNSAEALLQINIPIP